MGLRGSKPLRIAGAAVTVIGFGTFLLHALRKVLDGQGLETYQNYRGAYLSYAGAVVTGAMLVLCILAALVMKWWHHRQERKFEEFLRERSSTANTEEEKSAEIGS